jgi:SAM-dependent methyltransferase
MLGRATASLAPIPRRWLQGLFGHPDIDSRQKWIALWPHLARLPRRGLRLLDAGCGSGDWALELAALRPEWSILGIDCAVNVVEAATEARKRLSLTNVAFRHVDFMGFDTTETFDIVLSVASAHYLVEAGQGRELFQRFRAWLKLGGRLLLLGPRRMPEVPATPWLCFPPLHDVFSVEELNDLCRASDLQIEVICGHIGHLGTLAKQIGWTAAPHSRLLSVGLYPARWVLASLDTRAYFDVSTPTLMWSVVARAAVPRGQA